MGMEIFEWQDKMTWDDLGDLLNNKANLKRRLHRVLARNVQPTSVLQMPANLQQDWIDLYAEQVTVDAFADIERYFVLQKAKGLQTTPKGLPTGYTPLAIHPQDIRPSNTAIAAIGEGLGGWYLEREGMVPLRRPVNMPIDMLFRTIPWTHEVLVQIKATQEANIKGRMRESAIPFLQYTKNVQGRLASPVCYVLGVIIRGGGSFDLFSLRIDLT